MIGSPVQRAAASAQRARLPALTSTFLMASTALLIGLSFLASTALPGTSFGAPPGAAGTASKSSGDGAAVPSASLTLLGQTSWVVPGASFAMRVAISGTATSGGALALSLTLFQRLTSESAFAQSITGTPPGVVLDRTSPLPVSALPRDPKGGYDLFVPVATAGRSLPAGAPLGVSLPCVPIACGGVYPLSLELTDGRSGRTVASLVTQIVYVDPPVGTQKLRFAFVLPMSLPVPVPAPNGSTELPSQGSVEALERHVATLAAHPGVPFTLALEPSALATLGRLAAAAPRHSALRSLAASLAALADLPIHQTLALPFVPVDAPTLLATGLGSALSADYREGARILADAGVHATYSAWIGGALDSTALGELEALGVHSAVLPPSAVGGPSGNLTATQPFRVEPVSATTKGGLAMTAAFASRGLGNELERAQGQLAVLSAHWLLANLALVYFEQPNLLTVRGVVALPPPGWDPGPGFLGTLLSGLASSPVVGAVTLPSFFAQVPIGADRNPPARRLVDATPSASFPAKAARRLSAELHAFATAVSDRVVLHTLEDDLLAAVSSDLSAREQRAALAGTQAALSAQYHQLVLASERTITLTATSGRIPVTILSSAPYPVRAVVTLKSDGLAFPHGASTAIVLDRSTNAAYVDVRTRSPGDFPVAVTLTSPSGALVLLRGHLIVRSRAVSSVGIVLTAGAILVLLTWWVRTALANPRRRGAHSVRQARKP